MNQLSCTNCKSINCKLWFKKNNLDHKDKYCSQCLFEEKKLFSPGFPGFFLSYDGLQPYNSSLKEAPDWLGNDFFPAVEENYLPYFRITNSQIKTWRNLPDLPQWWQFNTSKAYERRINLASAFRSQARRLNLDVSFDSCFSCLLVGAGKNVDENDTHVSIPVALHALSWVRSINSLQETSFWKIFSKIEKKYI